MAVSANRLELLQIADAVAREKSIDRTIVVTAMEDAIAKAARSRYGAETDVHAEINAKTGELRLSRHMLVVDAVENPSNQIGLDDAKKRNGQERMGYMRMNVRQFHEHAPRRCSQDHNQKSRKNESCGESSLHRKF